MTAIHETHVSVVFLLTARTGRILFGAAALALTAGCSGDFEPDQSLAESEEPITGGTLVTSGQNGALPYSAAARIRLSGNGNCTAMKIVESPKNRYLTAAHCVDSWDGGDVLITHERNGTLSTSFDVARVVMHPSYLTDPDNANPSAAVTRSYDVAVIELNAPTTAPTVRVGNEHQGDGVALTSIGYGCDLYSTNDNTKQKNGFSTTSRATYGATVANYTRYLLLREDRFGGGSGELTGDPLNIDSVCAGDSGGPVVKNIGGTWNVVGVTVSGALDDGADNVIGANPATGINDDFGRSTFARAANISRWAGDLSVNDFTNNKSGFLQNFAARQCMTIDAEGRVALAECEGRSSTAIQYWKLVLHGACGAQTCFRIQNTLQSPAQCLMLQPPIGGPAVPPPNIVVRACDANDSRQRFWFAQQGGTLRHKMVSAANSTCISNSAAPQLVQSQCNVSGSQDWIFYP